MSPLEILQSCCDGTVTRYDLSRPFERGGMVYATNEHIAARAKINGIGPNANSPPTDKLKWDIQGKDCRLPEVSDDECDDYADCDKCKGYGDHDCECGNNHECAKCGGDGRGMPYTVSIGGAFFAAHYIRLLRKFGVETLIVPENAKNTLPARWKVGDVEGLLMGTNADNPAPGVPAQR